MGLSNSVKESLDEAQSQLKNALAYAARQEAPYVMVGIAKVIHEIDMIKKTDSAHEQLQKFINQINPDIQL
jgi:hypothetical protein